MSKLIQMRGRIQTIETIKKITHAMRLISMSSHSRLKTHQESLDVYIKALSDLFSTLQQSVPAWTHERLIPSNYESTNPLIIIVGSHKGLCGHFNAQLFKMFTGYIKDNHIAEYKIVAVGKKAIDYSTLHYPDHIVGTYSPLTARTFLHLAQQLVDTIMTASAPYSSVIVISNIFKSFFVQKPIITQLIPLSPIDTSHNTHLPSEGYLWDQDPQQILNELASNYLEAQFQHLLFQSLLSEHAARFISMDSATHNANSLLDRTKLEYNKLRQTKITTEITELTGNV